jgi:hypothetical protein
MAVIEGREVQEYSWWGFDKNEPPAHLKTKKQLFQMRLKPGEPVGVIRTPKYDCYLYDPSNCPPKKPLSAKQEAAIERRKQLKIEKERHKICLNLIYHLERITPLIKQIADQPMPISNVWDGALLSNRCQSIIMASRKAKEQLKLLYPSPEPEPGSLVLGGQVSTSIPLDPDGECRVAVLGSPHLLPAQKVSDKP